MAAPASLRPDADALSAILSGREKRWTAAEVERLVETGGLPEPERYELLHGRLIEKMSQNTPHIACVDLLTEALREVYGTGISIRSGSPVKGLADSEPEPDLMVLRGTARELRGRTPGPEDLLLLSRFRTVRSERMWGARRPFTRASGRGNFGFSTGAGGRSGSTATRDPTASGARSPSTILGRA